MKFARGSKALGICDRCGFAFRLSALRRQPVDGRLTRLRVCSGCMDEDNPQWMLRHLDLSDPQTLRDPRPDAAEPRPIAPLLWGGVDLRWNRQTLHWGEQ